MATLGIASREWSCGDGKFSFSLCPASTLVEIGKSDSCFWPATVLAAEVGYALMLLASLIEGVVRAILSIPALFVLLVIPNSCSDLRWKIAVITLGGTLVNLGNAAVAACALFENLIRCGNVRAYDNFYCADACNNFIECGFEYLRRWIFPPVPAPQAAEPRAAEPQDI